MQASRDSLERQLAAGARIYAVNTGYGADAGRVIPAAAVAEVQRNTLLSHSQGLGPAIPDRLVRGMLLLKANEFAQGPAAVRPELVDALLGLLAHDILPLVPCQGSLSASGDLVPQAHLGQALLGIGRVRVGGQLRPRSAASALRAAGLRPHVPAAKEGVSITNSTAFALAHGLELLRAGDRLLEAADLATSVSLQAVRGHLDAFDERVVRARPHGGALATAAAVRRHCRGSRLLTGPDGPRRHDPYCWRCAPQVHGAVRDALAYARAAARVELNATGDNPIVDSRTDTWLSGGNFHGQPLALPFDHLALALATLGSISQRRTAQLMEAIDPGLPPKLSSRPKTRLGMLMTATTALSLVAENRALCYPASADSSGTDAMEDHTSMAAVAARKGLSVAENVSRILAIELAAGAQALEFQGLGRASRRARDAVAAVRRRLPRLGADRSLSAGLEVLAQEVTDGRWR
jgi:histidine ammonia-lyase